METSPNNLDNDLFRKQIYTSVDIYSFHMYFFGKFVKWKYCYYLLPNYSV